MLNFKSSGVTARTKVETNTTYKVEFQYRI